jgi:hypothetical protein
MSLARGDGRSAGAGSNGDNRSSAELERDLSRIRMEMDQTISQIEHRLSPSRLIDQALERMRGGPAVFAANLGRTVRHHPVPAALFAAGLGWLLLAERGDKAETRSSRRRRSTSAPIPYHLREASQEYEPQNGSGRLEDASQRSGAYLQGDRTMSGSWDTSRRSGWNLFGRRGSRAGYGGSSYGSSYGGSGYGGSSYGGSGSHGSNYGASSQGGNVENGRGRMGQVSSAARHQVERARTGFEHMLEEQPLVLGAVAVALGAVLGATLPTSRIENRYLGPTREKLQHQAGDYAREQWEKAKEVALSAGAAAMSQAEEQGMTPGSMLDQAKDKISQVAGAATEAAREEAKQQKLGKSGPAKT